MAGQRIVVYRAAFHFLVRLIPGTFPSTTKPRFDFTVLSYAGGLAVCTALLFGILPAIKAARLDLNVILKGGAGKGSARGA